MATSKIMICTLSGPIEYTGAGRSPAKDMEAADGGDLDMVMYIMEVIEKREGGVSEVNKKAAAQALEEFLTAMPPPEGDGLQLYPCDTPDCAALVVIL